MTELEDAQLEFKALELKSENRDLKQWLQKSNCQQHYPKFVENAITFDLLSELDTESLIELGVTKLGDRLRLELAIASLKSEKLTDTITFDSLSKLMTQYIQEVNQERLHNLGIEGATDSTLEQLPNGQYAVNKDKDNKDKDTKTVTFILQDGSTKKVNVTGCFNAQSIKRKVLRKLGFRSQDPQYDAYIHNNPDEPAFMLYDVELVTICYSPERLEKHRIMFVPQGEVPSESSLETSKKILNRYEKSLQTQISNKNLNQYHMADEKASHGPALRNFFGQRPPSELISSNLAEYFPETKQKDLEATIRNSVRYSVRLSKRFNMPGGLSSGSSMLSSKRMSILSASTNQTTGTRPGRVPSRTVGDVMVGGYTAIDEVVTSTNDNLSIASSTASRESGQSTARNTTFNAIDGANNHNDSRSIVSNTSRTYVPPRIPIAASFADNNVANRNSRIELLNADSDSDEDIFAEYYDEDNTDVESISEEGPRHWLRGARIGAGSFGTVYLGMNPITGELMAVKQIPLPSQNSTTDIQKSMIEQQREMMLLKQLNHENIVRYYGSSTDENSVNIFLEYVPGGSVQTMLKSYGPFEEPLIRNFIRQVLIGLSYLHGEDIIHRDIKGANILIDIKGTVKIGDFGISRKVNQIEDESQKKSARRASLQGSVYWMAPEVVKQTAYTKKADIWSVGCLIVEMFTGKHPFPEFSQMQAIFKIGTHISPQIPEWCTEEAKQFLLKTFETDYKQRPDAVDLLGDAFLTPLIMSKK